MKGSCRVATMLTAVSAVMTIDAYAAANALTLTVRVDEALPPVVVLTNAGTAPCRVATTALGPLAIVAAEQDGSAIVPVAATTNLSDPLDSAAALSLKTLQSGESVEIELALAPSAETEVALMTVPWTGALAPHAWRYPIRRERPLRLTVAYAWSLGASGGPPLCEMATGSSSSPPVVRNQRHRWRWLLLGIGGAVGAAALFGAAGLVVVLPRRGVMTLAFALAVGPALQAQEEGPQVPTPDRLPIANRAPGARRTSGPGRFIFTSERRDISPAQLQASFTECITLFRQPDNDPANIVANFDPPDASWEITIWGTRGSSDEQKELAGQRLTIWWNPTDRRLYDDKVPRDPCDALYHEMFHAVEDMRGVLNSAECVDSSGGATGVPVAEVDAVLQAENPLRRRLKHSPRTMYGGKPIPLEGCRPTRPGDRYFVGVNNIRTCGPDCQKEFKNTGVRPTGGGGTVGDPHITTFDGRRYDFQAVGEFIAARDPSGGFEIQVRQQPYGNSRVVSVNTAIAMDVEGDRIQLTLSGSGLTVFAGGSSYSSGQVSLRRGGFVDVLSGRTATVAWPDGSLASVTATASFALDLWVEPAASRQGRLEGLLGNSSGSTKGTPSFKALYPAFADSWRVDMSSSLFAYAPGTTTATFTDRSLPEAAASAAGLPGRAAAEALCRQMQMTSSASLADCILDVASTGQPAFALAARAFEDARSYGPTEALLIPATSNIYGAGLNPVAALPGGAGTRPGSIELDRSARVIMFPEVRGTVGPWGASRHGPEGGPEFAGTQITPFNGLTGLRHASRSLFLVGAFAPVAASQTSTLDVTATENENEFRPALGELFFIGDGHTVDGAVQRFVVPSGATRLYVGFADACGFRGAPACYDDNTGAVIVRAALERGAARSMPVPAPGSGTPDSRARLVIDAGMSVETSSVYPYGAGPSDCYAGVKAFDGIRSGDPSTACVEWATRGEGPGAWIKVTFPQEKVIARVVLYDRPNRSEHVLEATIELSDGSKIPTGPLPDDGTGKPIAMKPATKASWFRVTIDRSTGPNIGLSEIEVYEGGK
jgi:hypothetical protein